MRKKILRCRRSFHIDGVGVDLRRFHPVSAEEKSLLRRQFGFTDADFILLYIAEFIPRKNHAFFLRQIHALRQLLPCVKIIFAGKGELLDESKAIAENFAVADSIIFAGYRNDIDMLCQIADVYIAPSNQEGLSISILEAMASGLPVVCSKIRGHTDAVNDRRNGFLFALDNPVQMIQSIITLYDSLPLRKTIAKNNVVDAQKFSVETAVANMANIYRKFM